MNNSEILGSQWNSQLKTLDAGRKEMNSKLSRCNRAVKSADSVPEYNDQTENTYGKQNE